jgi:hypothetical protein
VSGYPHRRGPGRRRARRLPAPSIAAVLAWMLPDPMRARRFTPAGNGVTRGSAALGGSAPGLRADLARLGIDAAALSYTEVFHLSCAVRGWHVTPRTPANARPIEARVWLAAALAAGGRYVAPERLGHSANLRDGGPPVDSVILMAVIQRHILRAYEPGWDDDALAEQLGLPAHDITRAQVVLAEMQAVVRRAQPPLGRGWWTRPE